MLLEEIVYFRDHQTANPLERDLGGGKSVWHVSCWFIDNATGSLFPRPSANLPYNLEESRHRVDRF